MTRTTRKLIIAKLTALYGNRRIWSKWIDQAYTRMQFEHQRIGPNGTEYEFSIRNRLALRSVISMAREVLNS